MIFPPPKAVFLNKEEDKENQSFEYMFLKITHLMNCVFQPFCICYHLAGPTPIPWDCDLCLPHSYLPLLRLAGPPVLSLYLPSTCHPLHYDSHSVADTFRLTNASSQRLCEVALHLLCCQPLIFPLCLLTEAICPSCIPILCMSRCFCLQ